MKKLYTALLTSFDKEGYINEKGLREIIRFNIDVNQVDGLYVGGSTGENFLLDTASKKLIFKIAFEETNGAVDLIAQVGSNDLHEAVELAKYVTDLGYKTISAVTPYYYKFDFEEVKNYYNTILAGVETDMIIYSIPFLTGVSLSVDQFAELFENEKIKGVKFTAADFYLLERMRTRFPDKLIYAGFDEMLLPALSLGVDGAIGSTFNVNAKRARATMEAVEKRDLDQAFLEQSKSNDLIEAILANGLYNTIKIILQEEGVDAGYCKEPMKKPSVEQIERAKEIYRTLV
ncbi:N-acetylneuraminate lyase [Granulicatella seriolae]|uniref:N-acetylneuraminate lyase n=1 Tax=Granulicatella seriolae TaxID=2967226 RepID=A0ABT1WLR1_9LACT|nr:N-acetylneuraminate lyase [Granulicatella seriolae]